MLNEAFFFAAPLVFAGKQPGDGVVAPNPCEARSVHTDKAKGVSTDRGAIEHCEGFADHSLIRS